MQYDFAASAILSWLVQYEFAISTIWHIFYNIVIVIISTYCMVGRGPLFVDNQLTTKIEPTLIVQ